MTRLIFSVRKRSSTHMFGWTGLKIISFPATTSLHPFIALFMFPDLRRSHWHVFPAEEFRIAEELSRALTSWDSHILTHELQLWTSKCINYHFVNLRLISLGQHMHIPATTLFLMRNIIILKIECFSSISISSIAILSCFNILWFYNKMN